MANMEDNRYRHLSMKQVSSIFNRSLTIHASSAGPLSRKPLDPSTSSIKRWFNPFDSAGNSLKGKVRQLRTLFQSPSKSFNSHSKIQSPLLSSASSQLPSPLPSPSHPHLTISRSRPPKSLSIDLRDSWSIIDTSPIQYPGTEDRVVLYITSLRGIRRTFDDCYTLRIIFRGYRVFVDERDLSMNVAYRKELQGLLGEKNVSLPQVFIKGVYIGGVDLIRHLNETGELRKLLKSLPMRDRIFVCSSCGDVRFVPCGDCSGSRKIFDEDEGKVKRCSKCNENGLIRCPECCYS